MNPIRIIENINNKFYKENYYYLYSMSIYHVLVILFSLLIYDIPVNVFYKLTFTPQATQNLISGLALTSFNSFIWSFLLLTMILTLDLIFIYIIVDEFRPKLITLKSVAIMESSILIISFFVPYLRDVFVFLSINTIIITFFYKIIKYEKTFTGLGFMKYIMITVTYIYIFKLVTYPVFKLVEYAFS